MARSRPYLVPVTDSDASFEALAHAGSIARRERAPVQVIHVIEVTRSLPVDAEMEWEARQGEQLLRRAEDMARNADFTLTAEMLQARQAGQAIVDEAHRVEAKAVVLGMQFRQMVGDFSLGSTVGYVLQHAHCPVWVIRAAAKD